MTPVPVPGEERGAEDHENAKLFARKVGASPQIRVDPEPVETNMVYFRLQEEAASAERFCEQLAERQVLMLADSPRSVRAVTHLDVSTEQVHRAAEVVVQLADTNQP